MSRADGRPLQRAWTPAQGANVNARQRRPQMAGLGRVTFMPFRRAIPASGLPGPGRSSARARPRLPQAHPGGDSLPTWPAAGPRGAGPRASAGRDEEPRPYAREG
jgi:hypothetical protein